MIKHLLQGKFPFVVKLFHVLIIYKIRGNPQGNSLKSRVIQLIHKKLILQFGVFPGLSHLNFVPLNVNCFLHFFQACLFCHGFKYPRSRSSFNYWEWWNIIFPPNYFSLLPLKSPRILPSSVIHFSVFNVGNAICFAGLHLIWLVSSC